MLPERGVYTLIIFLPENIRLKVGGLGIQTFQKGYYTYTGSALGKGAQGLSLRISRHLRKRKRKRWHIDFLLAHENVTVTAVVAAQTDKKLECAINQLIKSEAKATIPVMGFGASDCKRNCGSHLLYVGEKNVEPKIIELYSKHVKTGPTVLRPPWNNSPKV